MTEAISEEENDKDDEIQSEVNQYHPYDCAFCGEENEVFVDGSGARTQKFTEDCAVCCRPNFITIQIDRDGFVSLGVEREYDA